MGVGKSTLVNGLAEVLKLPQADSDRDIEALTGMHAAEYAAANGVPALHRLETAVLLGRLAVPEPTVISAAASAIENDECRVALQRRARVLWIDIDDETMRGRVALGGHRRPMWGDEATMLAERRRPLFEEVADVMLDGRLSADTLVDNALAYVRG